MTKSEITSTIDRKSESTKETHICNCETNKEEKTLSTYDNEYRKNKKL